MLIELRLGPPVSNRIRGTGILVWEPKLWRQKNLLFKLTLCKKPYKITCDGFDFSKIAGLLLYIS